MLKMVLFGCIGLAVAIGILFLIPAPVTQSNINNTTCHELKALLTPGTDATGEVLDHMYQCQKAGYWN